MPSIAAVIDALFFRALCAEPNPHQIPFHRCEEIYRTIGLEYDPDFKNWHVQRFVYACIDRKLLSYDSTIASCTVTDAGRAIATSPIGACEDVRTPS